MRLRKLKLEDAPLMFEWMREKDITDNFQVNFVEKTLSDCEKFIRDSQNDEKNLHMAIVDDRDVYMGTVSLKNIDMKSLVAEFAIVLRSSAMGKGFSKYAMEKIMEIGFEKICLKKIYWSVLKKNKRAICFYDKNGYQRVERKVIFDRGGDSGMDTMCWWYLETQEKDIGNILLEKN